VHAYRLGSAYLGAKMQILVMSVRHALQPSLGRCSHLQPAALDC